MRVLINVLNIIIVFIFVIFFIILINNIYFTKLTQEENLDNFSTESYNNNKSYNNHPVYSDVLRNKNYQNSQNVENPDTDKNSLINCLKTNNPNNCSRISSSFNSRPSEKNNPSYQQIEKDRVKNNINFNLFNTLTFNDVVVYDNEAGGRLGLDRCLDNKVGTCVPYGNMTGIAYYYPPQYNDQYFGEVVESELSEDEKNQPFHGKISYPNFR